MSTEAATTAAATTATATTAAATTAAVTTAAKTAAAATTAMTTTTVPSPSAPANDLDDSRWSSRPPRATTAVEKPLHQAPQGAPPLRRSCRFLADAALLLLGGTGASYGWGAVDAVTGATGLAVWSEARRRATERHKVGTRSIASSSSSSAAAPLLNFPDPRLLLILLSLGISR
uniref:Uncharacterized protein n=1 Tax=Oryza nivara TaxID=4536 RepID=A0A0E0FJG9_ORYNI